MISQHLFSGDNAMPASKLASYLDEPELLHPVEQVAVHCRIRRDQRELQVPAMIEGHSGGVAINRHPVGGGRHCGVPMPRLRAPTKKRFWAFAVPA